MVQPGVELIVPALENQVLAATSLVAKANTRTLEMGNFILPLFKDNK